MIDLHTHSTFSDGSNTPESLVELAVEAGLSAIALTDHDTTAGIPRFLEACKQFGISGIPGIEFSVDDEMSDGGQIHIIGLFVDHQYERLNNHALDLKNKRLERNRKILNKLLKLGVEVNEEDILGLTSDGVVGRAHIARVMLAGGYVKSVNEAFQKYLGPGRLAFVPKPRFAPEYIIRLIHESGGLAILAHPLYLKIQNPEDLKMFLLKMKKMGLDGIETHYPATPVSMFHLLKKFCQENGLLQSGGSDFHGQEVRPHITLGTGDGGLLVPDSFLDRMRKYLNNRSQTN